MIVRVPGSSANLGPGFDALGLALDIHTEVGIVPDVSPATGAGLDADTTDGSSDSSDSSGSIPGAPQGARIADEFHPATKAFRRAGGTGHLWVSSRLPAGRGLGFSGSVRVAGLIAASVQRLGPTGWRAESDEILRVAGELEGHPDNVAASFYGGVVAAAAGHVVRVPLGFDPAIVVWIPQVSTSTDESRAKLSSTVSFTDAVFNVGRTALLVAALAAGDVGALRAATQDRLHQDIRLARSGASRLALEAGLDAGAWCGWLSGSGPTIALMCAPDMVEALIAALPDEGRARHIRIDHGGAVVESA